MGNWNEPITFVIDDEDEPEKDGAQAQAPEPDERGEEPTLDESRT